MTRRGFAAWAVSLVALAVFGLAAAEAEEHAPPGAGSPSLVLSPELRAALVEEMQAVERQTAAIVAGAARADWEAVEAAAHAIAGVFILERALSPAQRAELHRVLPAEFLALDEWFHREAGALAEAARRREAALVVFRSQRMLGACVDCHAGWARERFPGFGPAAATEPEPEHGPGNHP
jgi:hypothetical protein